jgi:hypothetical protein
LFGLNTQERFYRIDSDGRKIIQVDLKCYTCQGIKMLKEARQKLAHILIAIQTEGTGAVVEPLKTEEIEVRAIPETPPVG